MEFNLVHVFRDMGPFAMAIVVVLVVMGLATLAVFLERLWVFFRSQKSAKDFAENAGKGAKEFEPQKLHAVAKDNLSSHLARLVSHGLATYFDNLSQPDGNVGAVELTRREADRQMERLTAELKRGLSILASVGSTAPFVGLLGTVIGIISAFQGIAAEGSGGIGAVSAGIAEALVVTAIGLLVAIPAVLAFNFLQGRVNHILLVLNQSKDELLDRLEDGHGRFQAPQ